MVRASIRRSRSVPPGGEPGAGHQRSAGRCCEATAASRRRWRGPRCRSRCPWRACWRPRRWALTDAAGSFSAAHPRRQVRAADRGAAPPDGPAGGGGRRELGCRAVATASATGASPTTRSPVAELSARLTRSGGGTAAPGALAVLSRPRGRPGRQAGPGRPRRRPPRPAAASTRSPATRAATCASCPPAPPSSACRPAPTRSRSGPARPRRRTRAIAASPWCCRPASAARRSSSRSASGSASRSWLGGLAASAQVQVTASAEGERSFVALRRQSTASSTCSSTTKTSYTLTARALGPRRQAAGGPDAGASLGRRRQGPPRAAAARGRALFGLGQDERQPQRARCRGPDLVRGRELSEPASSSTRPRP